MANMELSAEELAWSKRILESCALSTLLVRTEALDTSADIMAKLRCELDVLAWELVSRLNGVATNNSDVEIPLDKEAHAR